MLTTEYDREDRLEAKFARRCNFGILEVAVPAIIGGLSSLGVGAATAAAIAPFASAALVGAGTGALTAAVTGGKVLKGAGYGALAGLGGEAIGSLAGAAGVGSAGAGGAGAIPEFAGVAPLNAGPGAYGAGTAGTAASGLGALSAIPVTAPVTTGAEIAGMVPATVDIPAATAAEASGIGGLSWNQLGGGALSALAQASAKKGPAAGNAGTPDSTAATRGPLFDKDLPATGYLNRSLVDNYQPVGGNWYTYGQQSQPDFYNNNKIVWNPVNTSPVAPPTAMAQGGALSRVFSTGGGMNYLGGADAGQDDTIPAQLSDGEYVMDAGTVSRLGDGNSNAGARKLDQLREQVANDAGAKQVVQKKIKKSPLQSLQEAS